MKPETLPARVSAREEEVLAAIGEHLTNAEIAAKLFISVRTVESHVSSLLRKLDAPDRRALAALAPEQRVAPRLPDTRWPVPLTSFVGRSRERALLSAALDGHRLVTAVGPGGVGKTRLALTVAADVADRHPGGSWYVDLVPVADGGMVAATVAAAVGVRERPGLTPTETIVSWLAGREALLVLDNCEHLTDGVVGLLDTLLPACPGLTVLCTSRARLLVPYEQVFAVPGLSVGGDNDNDAIELFVARAVAAGAVVSSIDSARVGALCRGLDGMALAIELAAARVPSLGLEGLEAGLADRLELLSGGRRIDDRHRSLRSALDWSNALLSSLDQAVLRRVSVFAAPFSTEQAVSVAAGWAPVDGREVPGTLARLVDCSLLIADSGAGGMRYRALETIRQYGSERLSSDHELTEAHTRHQAWALEQARAVAGWSSGSASAQADPGFLLDELRAALAWAAAHRDQHAHAHELARHLGALCFAVGLPAEAQRRYEQAAGLAGTDQLAAADLRSAAGAAAARHFGDDAIRLHRASAAAARRAGDQPTAAGELAAIVVLVYRASGLIDRLPSTEEAGQLLADASALAGDDPVAQAQVGVARAFAAPRLDEGSVGLAEQAVADARRCGDIASECAALDQLMSLQLVRGQLAAAAASNTRRAALLADQPVLADIGLEFSDGFNMATDTAICVGDLTAARRYAQRVHDLPFHREEGHLATARLLVVTALSGDWDEAAALAARYRDSWERAGRPRDGDLNRGAYAAATAFGLRGDDALRLEWLDLVADLVNEELAGRDQTCYRSFDALLLLHRGDAAGALAVLGPPAPTSPTWHHGLWRAWHAAFWVEASTLAGRPDPSSWLEPVRAITVENVIARTIVERSAALIRADRAGVLATADPFRAAGCPYQAARSLELAATIG